MVAFTAVAPFVPSPRALSPVSPYLIRGLWIPAFAGMTVVGPGVQGRGLARPCGFLAFAYQTIWFQQLVPTQVRFRVSRFRMTSAVDLIRMR